MYVIIRRKHINGTLDERIDDSPTFTPEAAEERCNQVLKELDREVKGAIPGSWATVEIEEWKLT